jgi:hypothetical protein
MFPFVTDETNLSPSVDSKFFIYCGLALSSEQADVVTQGIAEVRQKYNLTATDRLKFDTIRGRLECRLVNTPRQSEM